MKFRFVAGLFVFAALVLSSGCSFGGSSSSSSQAGFLYVAAQGNTTLASFSIDVNSGVLSAIGTPAATGTSPTAMVMSPDGKTLFVANDLGTSQAGTVSSFSVNTDGTVTAAGTAQTAGISPKGLAIDPGGKYLFVADQGTFSACSATTPTDNSILVFSIQGTALTAAGTPVGICLPQAGPPSASYGAGPSALAVTPDGKYLYVANQFNNTISAFSIDSSGDLAEISGSATTASPFATAVSPSAVTITPDGAFLYVANFGSNSISVFSICDAVVTSCSDPNNPNGTLKQISGSPVSAGIGPVALATTPLSLYTNSGNPEAYLYVADKNSNQVSQYKISSVTGALSTLSSGTISTGANPVSIVVHTGYTNSTSTFGFVYAANFSDGTVSVYQFDVTNGVLTLVGSPVTTAGGASALASK